MCRIPARVEPGGDIAGEIEQGVAGTGGGNEETLVRRILGGKARDEIGTDFVVCWPDHRAKRRAYLTARAPSRSIASTVASATPASAPRQPACAAPTTPARVSAKRTGPQSAVLTPIASAALAGDDGVGARARARRSTARRRRRLRRVDLVGGEQTAWLDLEAAAMRARLSAIWSGRRANRCRH